MTTYHERLVHDAIALGATPPPYIDDMRTLSKTVTSVTKSSPERTFDHHPDLSTEFGRRAFSLLSQGVAFEQSLEGFCSDAERRLTLALDPVVIRSLHQPSPTLITHEGNLLGVAKRIGTQNLYGLFDSPDHNIYAGCWHRVTELHDRTRSSYATEQPVEQLHITPVRFSVFASDMQENRALAGLYLEDGDLDVLSTTHEDIVTRAENAYAMSRRSLKTKRR